MTNTILFTRGRGKRLSLLRAMAYAYLHDHIGFSYRELGQAVGRDATTVYGAVKRGRHLWEQLHPDGPEAQRLAELSLPRIRAILDGSHVPNAERPEPNPFPTPVPNPLEDILGRVRRFTKELSRGVPNVPGPSITVTVSINIQGTDVQGDPR